ncbi:MAG: c-type cytochrome [Wenzhouxiangella sp.]
MKAIGRFIRTVLILAVIVIGAAVAYALSGHYDVSVGSGHTALTNWYLETVRDRSIGRRAAEIEVPDLTDPDMIEAGAVAYDQACAGCHGRPGRDPSGNFEPRPPALTRGRPDPARTYWVLRNGIKMSAMPRIDENRLGDEEAWAAIAFLQNASSLTEGEYRDLVEQPEPEEEPAEADEEEEASEETSEEEAEDSDSENGEPEEEDDSDSRVT